VLQDAVDETGTPVRILYHGGREVIFDDPDEFGLASGLVRQPWFVAQDAVSWSEGGEWARTASWLDTLLDHGVLERLTAHDTGRPEAPTRRMAAPLPDGPATVPSSWADAERLTETLCGRPLSPAHLELVVPVFRVAHPAGDRDGRQVGEANVFPPALRTAVPTEWRACPHAGTRFQSDRPMNVTALRTMRTHWPQMMEILKRLRALYLMRFPADAHGWTVAGVERLATLVMAVPTYAALRADRPLPSDDLHPALSSVFRVTDGLRMTAHQMLFVPGAEPNLAPDTSMTARQIYDYAERNYNFHSPHGVCAGPQVLIEEFLSVLLDGHPPRDDSPVRLEPELLAVLDDAERAFDYGLLGLQVHFVAFSHWPLMARAVADLAALYTGTATAFAEGLTALQGSILAAGYHSDEARRSARLFRYAALAQACNGGLPAALRTSIPRAWTPVQSPKFPALHVMPAPRDPHRRGEAEAAVAAFALASQQVLSVAGEVQDKLNGVLGRAAARRAFEARDMQIHLLLQGRGPGTPPHLLDLLSASTGLRLCITRHGILTAVTHLSSGVSPPASPRFVGISSANKRAPGASNWR
jgi:hypothetical protein